jgi:hypothetical protein
MDLTIEFRNGWTTIEIRLRYVSSPYMISGIGFMALTWHSFSKAPSYRVLPDSSNKTAATEPQTTSCFTKSEADVIVILGLSNGSNFEVYLAVQ